MGIADASASNKRNHWGQRCWPFGLIARWNSLRKFEGGQGDGGMQNYEGWANSEDYEDYTVINFEILIHYYHIGGLFLRYSWWRWGRVELPHPHPGTCRHIGLPWAPLGLDTPQTWLGYLHSEHSQIRRLASCSPLLFRISIQNSK